ncbi:MAG: signal recognition particle protein [Thermoanaerobacterales bacterium]|jgi:signal recognition particle subunit SRP54|nr:signal recognition particle protein [Thermoanaerobacterales bacterium]
MFESLSERFEGIFARLRSKGTLRESDVDEVLREIRLALLEADVNYVVVRSMLARIRERAVGTRVHEALNPSQQVVKLVNEALVEALGGETFRVQYASRPPTVVLMAGLQGSGKTTTSAKLARWFRQQGRNPLLVGADLQRPAAVEQLRTLGERVGVPVFSQPGDPVETARAGVEEARRLGRDVCIVDTAGRLAIDAEMMDQVRRISEATAPDYTFLVVDAMTGQDAVTVAESFDQALALDAVILTKLDGDARGGAALSVKEVVGKPIAFASTGEKVEDFDLFHPDRLASRILGMGDVLTLIEKAEQVYEKEEAEKAAARLLEGRFTLEDFLEQLQQVRKMGPLQNLMGMLPGLPKEMRNAQIDEKQINRVEAIIRSMTPEERADPTIIDGSRRQRIARGSGTQPSDVSQLVKQFREMQKLMKRMPGLSGTKAARGRKAKGKAKGRKGRKGGRVTPPGTGRTTPKQPFTLPGLN